MTLVRALQTAVSPRAHEPELAAFTYHDVTADPSDSGFQRPAATRYKLSPAVFAGQLDAIGAAGTPRLITDVNLAIPGRHRLLTFDDGKRSNFTEIAPELEARRVPAVFYVTTEPLSHGTGLWFDRHAQLVRHLGYCPGGLELPTLKQLPFDLLTKRLDSACAHYDFLPDNAPDDLQPMSWDDARDLARRGFTIGAHGLTHAILTNETKARALAEIGASLAIVSAALGAPCRTFAFPNGNYTEELARHATRCGATTVMTTEPMWLERDVALWRLPRIQIFGEFSPARIELKLALAAQPGALANPDGSGRTYHSRSRSRVGRDHTGVKPDLQRENGPWSNFAK